MKSKRTTLRCVLANGPGSETVVGKSQRWPHSSLGDATRCCGRCWSVLLRGDRGDSGWPSAMDSERDRCFGLSALPASVTHRGLCLTLSPTPGLATLVCVDVYAKEDPSSPPSMALSVLWRVQGFTFSAVSAETKKKAERRPEALQKEDHTTPCPDQAGV